ICVHVTEFTVAFTPPNVTVAPLWNPAPAMVVTVPGQPEEGVTVLTAMALYVKPFGRLAVVAFVFVTVTVLAPLPAGTVAVIFVLLAAVAAVGMFGPTVTVAPAWNWHPLIVTTVPAQPVFGDTLATCIALRFEFMT